VTHRNPFCCPLCLPSTTAYFFFHWRSRLSRRYAADTYRSDQAHQDGAFSRGEPREVRRHVSLCYVLQCSRCTCRAYIAASRRSDRSLEARIESARRASEIHKKRTGRRLRVTEQDVMNEEMYEEEDEDLPAQYRRLTAHLQTGSADFNRRFHAYILAHAGTRASQFPELFQNASPLSGNPSQFLSQNLQQGMSSAPHSMMMPPQMMPQSPSYWPPTFPTSNVQAERMSSHQRSASVTSPQDLTAYSPGIAHTPDGNDHRRFSLPAQTPAGPPHRVSPRQNRPSPSRTPSTNQTTPVEALQDSPPTMANFGMQHGDNTTSFTPQGQMNFNAAVTTPSGLEANQRHPFAPYSPSLPFETRQILGSTPEQSNPMSTVSYTYNPNPSPMVRSPQAGMPQTMSPYALSLDTSSASLFGSDLMSATFSSGHDYSSFPLQQFTPVDSYDPLNTPALTRNSSQHGEVEWNSFFDLDGEDSEGPGETAVGATASAQ
jgi:hypothetical protein